MNMQHTTKIEDIQNKGEGKGLMDNAASELMAISMHTSTIFALPVATWFESMSTWPENILLIQDSGSTFQCVSIPSSFPSQEILLAWKQAEGDLPPWLLPPWTAVGLSPWKCQIHKQATCPGGESENPKESVHDPLHMSWNQGKRWIHNKYSDSRKNSKSHCSPNTDYLSLNIDSQTWLRCLRHTDQPGWWHALSTNTEDTTTAKQDVWCRQTPESNTSKIDQVFTVAMLPFSCIQGSSLVAF